MSVRGQNEAEITALLIAPNRELAQQFLATVPQTRAFQILADLKSYPPQQTLEIRARQLKPNVVLLDLSMPGRSGIELIKQVRAEKPKLPILVLSMHQEHQYAVRAIKAGAAGYLTKESAAAQLVTAIRKVAGGGAFVTPAVAERLVLDAMPRGDGPLHERLSDREFQVLRLLVAGQTVSEVAGQLNLSVKTVSTHKARIMEKMNLSNPTELIRYAIQHGLIDDSDSSPA